MTQEQLAAARVKQLEVAMRPLPAGYPLDEAEVRRIVLTLQNEVRHLEARAWR